MSYVTKYQISFAIATLFALAMLPSNLEWMKKVYWAKNETKTSTGVLETKKDRKEDLSKTIQAVWKIIPQVNASEKEPSYNIVTAKNVEKNIRTPSEIYEQVKHLWYRKTPTLAIINACKGSSRDPRHCILVWLTLMYNEAGNQQKSKACVDRNNCFWIGSGKASYSSLEEAMETWVIKYNRYWYKAGWANFFYSSAWKVSPSRYCTSEDSSWSSIGCPHGLSIASAKWKSLYSIIY